MKFVHLIIASCSRITAYSATAHEGGTAKDEKNHITAQFHDAKGRPLPSSWTDKKTGETMVGEKNQHHVYVNDKLTAPFRLD